MNHESYIRTQITELLDGRQAHVTFEEAVRGLSWEVAGESMTGFEHTFWQIVEHMRIAQWDILEFSRDPKHVSPKFPEGYWPEMKAPTGMESWEQALARFRQDLAAMKTLVMNPDKDLYKPFPHGQGQTLFREALLLADHNAYHIGQIVLVRKHLGIWDISGFSYP